MFLLTGFRQALGGAALSHHLRFSLGLAFL
jgi:hypothetical protein